DSAAQRQAERYFLNLKANSKEITGLLLATLKDADVRVREGSALALGQLDGSAKLALDQLIHMLKCDQSPTVRSACANSIRLVDGRSGVVYGALLQTMMKDPDSTVRLAAVANLREMPAPDREFIPDLLSGLKDSEKEVRIQTAFVLAKTRRLSEFISFILNA